jgi:hypothetical protein
MVVLNLFNFVFIIIFCVFMIFAFVFLLEFDSKGTDKFGHFAVIFLDASQVGKNTVELSESLMDEFGVVLIFDGIVKIFNVVLIDLK